MGGRQNNDPTPIHSSSIVLLQERFRQLERVKEMREEREVIKMLVNKEPARLSSTPNKVQYYEPTRLFFHPADFFLQRNSSPPQVSLSLWPNVSQTSNHDNDDFISSSSRRVHETPLLMNLWPTDADTPFVRASSMTSFDDYDSDVDTSLHL